MPYLAHLDSTITRGGRLLVQPLSSAGFAAVLAEHAQLADGASQLLHKHHRLPSQLVFGEGCQSVIASRLLEREALLTPQAKQAGAAVFVELLIPLPIVSERQALDEYVQTARGALLEFKPQLEALTGCEVLVMALYFEACEPSPELAAQWQPCAYVVVDRMHGQGQWWSPQDLDVQKIRHLCTQLLGMPTQCDAVLAPSLRSPLLSLMTSTGLRQAQERIHRLEAQLVSAMAGSKSLRDESVAIRMTSQDLAQRNHAMAQESRMLRAANSALRVESTALRAKNEAMEAESQALRAKNDAIEQESKALRAQNSTMEQESRELRSENDAFIAESAVMQAHSQALHIANHNMQSESDGLREKNTLLLHAALQQAYSSQYAVVRAFLRGCGHAQEADFQQLQQLYAAQSCLIAQWAGSIDQHEQSMDAQQLLHMLRSQGTAAD